MSISIAEVHPSAGLAEQDLSNNVTDPSPTRDSVVCTINVWGKAFSSLAMFFEDGNGAILGHIPPEGKSKFSYSIPFQIFRLDTYLRAGHYITLIFPSK